MEQVFNHPDDVIEMLARIGIEVFKVDNFLTARIATMHRHTL